MRVAAYSCLAAALLAATPALAQGTPPSAVPGQWYVPDPAGMGTAPSQGGGEQQALRNLFQGTAASGRYGAPVSFVIEIVRQPSYEPERADVSGWLGSTAPTVGYGPLEGTCLVTFCVVTATLAGSEKLVLRLDLAPEVPRGSFSVAPDNWTPADLHGDFTLKPLADGGTAALDLPLAGRLDGAALAEALSFVGYIPDGDAGSGGVSASVRLALAAWQQGKGVHPTGFLGAEDWAALKAEADEARAAAGWTPLVDEVAGWTLTYPAKTLTRNEKIKGGRKLASADGSFTAEITVEPLLDDAAFDAMFEKLSTETDKRQVGGYSRSNQDLWLQASEGGKRETVLIHSREGGMVRLVIRHPEAGTDEMLRYAEFIASSLKVAETVKIVP